MKNKRNGIARFETLLRLIPKIKCFLYLFSVLTFKLDLCICLSVCLVELDQSLQGLLSFERLDRASPDLWPEQSELLFVARYCSGKLMSHVLTPKRET